MTSEYAAEREAFHGKASDYWRERQALVGPIDKMLSEKHGLCWSIGGYEHEYDIETVHGVTPWHLVPVWVIEDRIKNEVS